MAAPAKKQSRPRRTLGITTEPKTAKAPAPPVEQEPPEPEDKDTRAILTNIEQTFADIGTDVLPGTKLPVAERRNNAEEAAEFVMADKLKKLAENRYKKAKEAAAKAGIFGDEKTYKAGDAVLVWNSPHYAISMKLGAPSTMVDRQLVETTLVNHLGQEKGQAAMEECLKERAGAKQIVVSIK